ncbi:GFA family protein [Paludibacterium paludis]|uniref:Aldehyde-activating protein n=1 Tax=Paludibacterium paludis TaxID=1225769 RepID=A0A918U7M2_9NEIS|nr:GFA family protein [Paludibacterium paludis]GGY06278.1 aldehyde-activating protein [Paludibacterium paludis]
MMTFLTGRCLCGAIHYRVSGPPLTVDHCHCASCRKASGAPFVTWFTARAFDVDWRGAPLAWYVSSVGAERGFCGRCGSTLAYRHDAEPEEIDITVATLDHPQSLTPEHHLCWREHLPWVEPDTLGRLPLFEGTKDNAIYRQTRRHSRGDSDVTMPSSSA